MPNDETIEVGAPDLLDDPVRGEFLSDEDVVIIEDGLYRMADKLQRTDPCDLPMAILFTETSARPFAYAFKPVVDKLYADKGLRPPALRFILTQHSTDLAYEIVKPDFEWVKSWDAATAKTRRRTVHRLASAERRLRENDFADLDSGFSPDEHRAGLEQLVEEDRQWLQALPATREKYRRAWMNIVRTIWETAEMLVAAGRRPCMLIVDEHVYGAGTLRFLEAAYRSVRHDMPKLRVRYFTFIDGHVDRCEGREGGFRRKLGYRLIAASSHGYDGFSYMEDKELKPAAIGVAKSLDRDSVFRAPQRDLAKMRFLRRVLRRLGEEAASLY